MKNKIYMAGADVGPLEIEYVTDALKHGWYEDKYYYVEKLEKDFASYHKRQYALMTPNCTSAIHLLLASLGIKEGDEVIAPECTWIASVVSSIHLGAKVIFCDIQNDSWCLDPKSVEKSITSKTKAIIAVDLFGNMPDWDELEKISTKYNIPIIEDAAEALGSSFKGKKAGGFGIGSTFSFHNTKTMTTGEGGMLLVDDKEIYDKCILLRDLGRGPNTQPYFNELVGYKFMPFNIQAAIGLAQFERIEELIGTKKYHLNFYRDNLKELNVTFNHEPPHIVNGAWITGMVIGKEYGLDKNEFIERLANEGIPARPFFYPLSSIPAFNQENYYKEKNPMSYDISSRGVNLPGAANLREDDLSFICKGIKKVLNDGNR
jgi:perosamine synthetase